MLSNAFSITRSEPNQAFMGYGFMGSQSPDLNRGKMMAHPSLHNSRRWWTPGHRAYRLYWPQMVAQHPIKWLHIGVSIFLSTTCMSLTAVSKSSRQCPPGLHSHFPPHKVLRKVIQLDGIASSASEGPCLTDLWNWNTRIGLEAGYPNARLIQDRVCML